MIACFFSYFLVSTGHNTVPSSMLPDIIIVGSACVIAPPLDRTFTAERIPVLMDVIPIVIDGPSISAMGTVSCLAG